MTSFCFGPNNRIVIFTNQGNIRSALEGKRATAFKAYVDAFLKEVSVPVLLLASTQRDSFRKPLKGMWEHLEKAKSLDFYWKSIENRWRFTVFISFPMMFLVKWAIGGHRCSSVFFKSNLQGNGFVDKSASFYVGDASGAPNEHSADDSEFAKAVGVRRLN